MRVEKRQQQRLEVDLEAKIVRAEGAVPRDNISVANISLGGAYFFAEEAPDVGDFVEIRSGGGLSFSGRVIRVDRCFEEAEGFAVKFEEEDQAIVEDQAVHKDNGGRFQKVFALTPKKINESSFSYYPRLNRVREYIEEHYDEDISLEMAAGIAAMERTYFSRFFHQKMGLTFRDWLQYVRIKKALTMIAGRNETVTEVAFAVGFNNLPSFERAFKKWTSLQPREFKNLTRPA